MIGAVRPGHRQLVGTARSGDHRGTERLAGLHRREADATGRAMYQQHLARLQIGVPAQRAMGGAVGRSEEHTSELQSLMRISYAVFCLKKKTKTKNQHRS